MGFIDLRDLNSFLLSEFLSEMESLSLDNMFSLILGLIDLRDLNSFLLSEFVKLILDNIISLLFDIGLIDSIDFNSFIISKLSPKFV